MAGKSLVARSAEKMSRTAMCKAFSSQEILDNTDAASQVFKEVLDPRNIAAIFSSGTFFKGTWAVNPTTNEMWLNNTIKCHSELYKCDLASGTRDYYGGIAIPKRHIVQFVSHPTNGEQLCVD